MSDKEDSAAFEKSLKRVTGLTRTEFRDELIQFDRTQRALSSPRPFPTISVPPLEKVEVREIKLDPVPINLESTGQSNTSAPSGAALSTETITITLSKNGVPTDYVLNGHEA